MGLMVTAQAVRDLISEGDYFVECIEQREHGRVMVTLALRSRAQPYTIQIETGDGKLEGLFRALMHGKGSGKREKAGVRVGSQPVPVVEVEVMPGDQPKRRRQRPVVEAAQMNTPNAGNPSSPEDRPTRAKRRRSAVRQLILVPQETPLRPAQAPDQRKRRAGSKSPPTAVKH